MAGYLFTCEVCGKEFRLPTAFHAKYCSIPCWKEAKDTGVSHMDDVPKYLLKQSEQLTSRHCHDCGKPTSDYRCEECWAKIREGLDDDDDFFEPSSSKAWKG